MRGIEKVGVSGNDAALITGLGPVGLAAAMLCRALGANQIIGIDVIPERMEIAINKGIQLLSSFIRVHLRLKKFLIPKLHVKRHLTSHQSRTATP